MTTRTQHPFFDAMLADREAEVSRYVMVREGRPPPRDRARPAGTPRWYARISSLWHRLAVLCNLKRLWSASGSSSPSPSEWTAEDSQSDPLRRWSP